MPIGSLDAQIGLVERQANQDLIRGMDVRLLVTIAVCVLATGPAMAEIDQAVAFGAREGIEDIALSPDGKQIAFIAPGTGQSSGLFVVPVDKSSPPKRITGASGNPERLTSCYWVSNTRLLCSIYVIQKAAGYVAAATRLVAVDSTGTNVKLVSRRDNPDAFYYSTYGGNLIDLLPGQDGAVLVARSYIPQKSIGSLITKETEGLGVDRVDTATLATKPIVSAMRLGTGFISDGLGNVRIAEQMTRTGEYTDPTVRYVYRPAKESNWLSLSEYNTQKREGFRPVAVDPTENVAYGFQRVSGRQVLQKMALDGSGKVTPVYAHPDVDVDGLIRIGRKQRIVGVSYSTDRRRANYFDPIIAKLVTTLGKALPQAGSISVVDASEDENRLLIRTDSDNHPGQYYLLDRAAKRLEPLLLVRPELANQPLATVKPIVFPAADGTMIPAYLTLPVGSTGKGLPAIVMPHGGPEARDEWGFDWWAQFYASRGFAVIQPNFRGSSGYGDAWFQKNGFQGWRLAIGDVVDSGKWLVKEGIADPNKLAIVGWSYGGYAALQSGVIAPDFFKAIVAVAPVTDLGMLKAEYDGYRDKFLARTFIGSGPDIIQSGSPARHAAEIKAPVLMFHGEVDGNVEIAESKVMDEKLRAAGKSTRLVTYPALDHGLADSAVRADMLRQSDAFLRTSMGIR